MSEETYEQPTPETAPEGAPQEEDFVEPKPLDEYNPREDPGPERYEDKMAPTQEDPAELSAEEVDPEEARKDETTVLASDIFDSEGNRVN